MRETAQYTSSATWADTTGHVVADPRALVAEGAPIRSSVTPCGGRPMGGAVGQRFRTSRDFLFSAQQGHERVNVIEIRVTTTVAVGLHSIAIRELLDIADRVG